MKSEYYQFLHVYEIFLGTARQVIAPELEVKYIKIHYYFMKYFKTL